MDLNQPPPLHYTKQGSLIQKTAKRDVLAEEISDILEEFEIEPSKMVAVTVGNAGNMDITIKRLSVIKNRVVCPHIESGRSENPPNCVH